MQRLTIHITIALLTFGIGVSIWFANPMRWIKSQPTEPLYVTISPTKEAANSRVPFEHFIVTVKNVSRKTIRGYSLGHTCHCLGYDDDSNAYPDGINFTIPNPERQVLHPGESRTLLLRADILPAEKSERRVWADLVHFKGGDNWGMNQSRREGYVRE